MVERAVCFIDLAHAASSAWCFLYTGSVHGRFDRVGSGEGVVTKLFAGRVSDYFVLSPESQAARSAFALFRSSHVPYLKSTLYAPVFTHICGNVASYLNDFSWRLLHSSEVSEEGFNMVCLIIFPVHIFLKKAAETIRPDT